MSDNVPNQGGFHGSLPDAPALIDNSDIWYSHGPLASHNGLFNLTIGGRGTGKTFDYKKWAINKDSQTVWVRRIPEDLKEFEPKFFPDLMAQGVVKDTDEWKIKHHTIIWNGEEKVFFMPLKTGRRFKSSSFINLRHIIFDEFIDEENKYLPDEMDRFISLYETINRLRLDCPEVRVFFIGNKVNFQNPYFSFWDIKPFEGRFHRYLGGAVVVENYHNARFEELKKATRSYQALRRSSYMRAMVDNTSWLDTNAFIRPRPNDAIHYANIHLKSKDLTFGIWTAKDPRAIHCCRAHNPTSVTFAPIFSCDDGELPLNPKSSAFELIKLGHDGSFLYFDDNGIKDAVISILQGGYKK